MMARLFVVSPTALRSGWIEGSSPVDHADLMMSIWVAGSRVTLKDPVSI